MTLNLRYLRQSADGEMTTAFPVLILFPEFTEFTQVITELSADFA